MEGKKLAGKFSAIDIKSYKPTLAEEIEVRGKDYVYWGADNRFPQYLYDIYTNCATLQSILNGTIDYVTGNAIVNNTTFREENSAGDTMEDVVRKLVVDRLVFGGCAPQVRYNDFGVSEILYSNIAKCRISVDRQAVYYLDDWKTYGNNMKAMKFPAFDPEKGTDDGSQIYFYKGMKTRGIYPQCDYFAALVSAETQIEIQKFHYNSIINSFMCNGILNFNNAADVPDDQKDAIEIAVNQKFSGSDNAGTLMVAWNEDADKAVTFTRITDDQFDTKYASLAESTRENLFVAMRAIPVLFGLTIQTGFNTQEYEEAFRLYNRTVVRPIQNEIIRVMDRVTGIENSISFEPFTL